MLKLLVSISRVSVEGLKFVILSTDFFLNLLGDAITIIPSSIFAESLVPLPPLISPVLCEGMLRNENFSRNFMNAYLYPSYPVQSSV